MTPSLLEQDHRDGTGNEKDRNIAAFARQVRVDSFKAGLGAWRDLLFEEVANAFAEPDPVKLRAALVEVKNVAVAWVEAIDRRPTEEAKEAA